MGESPRISDSEWQIMKILWDKSPLTSTEIIAKLDNNNDWSPKTVHTLISRLVKKGAIEAKKEGNFYLYFPLVAELETKKNETESFIQRVYNGSIQLFVANFIKQEKLTEKEIEELQNILSQKKDEVK